MPTAIPLIGRRFVRSAEALPAAARLTGTPHCPHYDQWALRVRGEGGGAVLVKYAFTALQESGYRTGDNYYDVDGELIEGSRSGKPAPAE